MKHLYLICLLLIGVSGGFAQGLIGDPKYTLSGFVKDATNGEMLVGAAVMFEETNSGVATNVYGYYSLSEKPGKYKVLVAFIGYENKELTVDLNGDQEFNISLQPKSESIEEVVVSTERKDANVRQVQMGVQKLKPKSIKQVPVLMGETDVIKVIQLMPGVQAASEGSSGFSVRGGNPDQNLVLLDEATVYNAGHMLGFFSVFNNDAIKGVELYKGDIPASSGGRLSSLLDVRMKDGNKEKLSGTGGLGLISSRLTLEGPIASEKTSFVVSGRRTYMDVFLPFAAEEAIRDNKIYFYDLNAKVNHTINQNNRLYLSGYFGRDVFKNQDSKMSFGNQTITARWNHLFSQKLFSNISVVGSNYDYELGGDGGEDSDFSWVSNLKDVSLKLDFDYFLSPKHTIEFGGQTTYHEILPGLVKSETPDTVFKVRIPETQALEHGLYVSNIHKLTNNLTLKYGLRYSVFQNMGKTNQYLYDAAHNVQGVNSYDQGEIYNTYSNIEPRLGAVYMLNPVTSIKASYSRTAQYMQLASNSTAGTPLDVWFMASPNVKPQKADQVSIGVFRNFLDNTIEASIETFYKKMYNTIDFRNHALLFLNEHLEGELRFGSSRAYGSEFLVRLDRPKWNGWIGYTWSKSERLIPEIQDTYFDAPFDHTHDVSIVLNRTITKRLSVSANWVYMTGNPMTVPVGYYETHNSKILRYSERNAERMPDYHRLDFSVILKSKNYHKSWWKGEWVFSVYNAYGQKNAWIINFVDTDEGIQPEKTYLFSVVPAITYNFKF